MQLLVTSMRAVGDAEQVASCIPVAVSEVSGLLAVTFTVSVNEQLLGWLTEYVPL